MAATSASCIGDCREAGNRTKSNMSCPLYGRRLAALTRRVRRTHLLVSHVSVNVVADVAVYRNLTREILL